MKVTGIVNKILYSNDAQKSQANKPEESKSKDVISISGEARALKIDEVNNLDEIREKMANGYYNSDKILGKVAEEIYKEIVD